MKTTIYLIRHGTTFWNEEGRMQGISDIELSEKGLLEAENAGEQLKNISFSAIYTSPLRRAAKTAEAIGKHHDLFPIHISEFKERSFGIFEGLTWDEIDHHPSFVNYGKTESFYARSEKGESFHDVYLRTSKQLDALVQKHPNETIAVVAHSVVIKVLGFHIGRLKVDELSH